MVNIMDYLHDELIDLAKEFQLMFPKYGTTWKDMTIHQLIKRIDKELRETWSAYQMFGDEGFHQRIHAEALDIALTALLLAESCKRLQQCLP